eukprot:gene7047-7838_t
MRVHHIELICRDIRFQVSNFCNRFGFSIYGTWKDHLSKKEKIVMKKKAIYFVLHQSNETTHDYIDNIALESLRIRELCKSIDNNVMHVSPQVIVEKNHAKRSLVEGAVIKSPIGNLKHTLLDKSKYNGIFLPGFAEANGERFEHRKDDQIIPMFNEKLKFCSSGSDYEDDDNICALDHITFAVTQGTSLKLMHWYEKYLQFTRCQVNKEEEQDGFDIMTSTEHGSKLGLRLTAMKYYFCSEEMMKMSQTLNNEENNVTFLFAESLGEQGPNQVDTFLDENGGPGVQHIGLSTLNIFKSVEIWKRNQVPFINPPCLYYNEIEESIKKINFAGLRELLIHYGVLLDIEDSEMQDDKMYLLQVFSKPIFEKQTFFFEFIQRHGATGFGAGNISALWRAVENYLRNDNTLNYRISS